MRGARTQSAPLAFADSLEPEVLTASVCTFNTQGGSRASFSAAVSTQFIPTRKPVGDFEPPGSELTFRALGLGVCFALINAAVNMYFNFRYAGGLGQYWVIIVSYVILRGIEKLPLPDWINPKKFGPKEHCIATLTGASAAFTQSLGLTGGLAPLELYYGKTFTIGQLMVWTVVAAFFGVFLGVLYGELLVLHDRFPWPIAQMNAVTIRSFHVTHDDDDGAGGADGALGSGLDDVLDFAAAGGAQAQDKGDYAAPSSVVMSPREQHRRAIAAAMDNERPLPLSSPLPLSPPMTGPPSASSSLSASRAKAEREQKKALRLFFLFFVIILVWYLVANLWLQFLVTFPLLCWLCSSPLCQVLGEGYVGIGLPGITLGPSIFLGMNGTIISVETLAWMAIGAAISFWGVAPALYYSGVTIWPGGLQLFNSTGQVYRPGDGRIELSSTMYLTMTGICLTLIGQLVDSLCTIIPAAFSALKQRCGSGDSSDRGSINSGTLRQPLRGSMSAEESGQTAAAAAAAASGALRATDTGGLTLGYDSVEEIEGRVPTWVGLVGVVVGSVAFVVMVEVFDMGMPWWGTVITILCSITLTYGLGQLMGTAAQNMAFPSSMLLQLLFGFILPGNGTANIMAAAINNAIAAQSLTLMNDYRTAVLLRVRPRSMMVAQLLGTAVGVVSSVLVFYTIMSWNASGKITLGTGVWANLGAMGSHLLAQLFGQYGLGRIFADHPEFLHYTIVMLVIGVLGPIIRRRVPEASRPYFPDTILIGLGQFFSAFAFSITSAVALGLFYQVYLKRHHAEWYKKYQMISTSGMNMGVGIGGLLVFLASMLGGPWIMSLGGPVGDGCMFPPNMPQN